MLEPGRTDGEILTRRRAVTVPGKGTIRFKINRIE
jgi:hypothetical protein